jgi:outer membrane protein
VTARSKGRGAGLAACFLITLAIAPVTFAAAPMTLKDCVSQALTANPDIRDAGEALSQAGSGIKEARAGFLPSLALVGSYNFMEKTQTVAFPDPLTGKTADFVLDFTRDYDFQLSATQPLYTGGRVLNSYRIAALSRQAAREDLTRVRNDVAMGVVQSFYGLLLAREGVTVAQEAVNTAQEFLSVVKERYKTGEASSFEVLRAEVEVSNLEPALIGARNAEALSELALKKAMGVKQDAEIEFTGSLETPGFNPTLSEAIDRAVGTRPEIRMAELQRRMAEASVGVAKSGRLPTLSVDINYDVSTDNLTLDSDQLEDTYAGYLVLSLPLFDGLRTKAQISRAAADVRRADIAQRNLEEAIELEIRSDYLDIEAARERLNSQEKNVGMATEALRIANERYVQGYATNLEVLDSQLALNTARQNRLQAIHDLNLAVARLKNAMGILLDDYQAGAPQ